MLDEIKRAEQKEKEKNTAPINEPKSFKSEGYSNYLYDANKKNSINKEPPSKYGDFPKTDIYKSIPSVAKPDPYPFKYSEAPLGQKKFQNVGNYDYPMLDPSSFEINRNKAPSINNEIKDVNKQPIINKMVTDSSDNYRARPSSKETRGVNLPAPSYNKQYSQKNSEPPIRQEKKPIFEQIAIQDKYSRNTKVQKPQDPVYNNQFHNNNVLKKVNNTFH